MKVPFLLSLAAIMLAVPAAVVAQGPMIPAGPMPPIPIFPPTPAAQSSGITVSGHAQMKVKADIAKVTLSVETDERDESVAVQKNAALTKAVVDALAKAGVASKDIQTDYYTVSPDYADNTNPPVITGYTVTNSVDVTIRDISKAGLIVDKATSAGATSSDGLSFDLADRSKAEGEALVAAVADARSKADLIAGAAGVSVGRLLWINESANQPQPIMPMMRMAAMASSAQTTPISPQDIEIDADVTASYAIDYSSP